VVIAHEAIPNYMAAMTMPFKVKEVGELPACQPAATISSSASGSTDTESWVEASQRLPALHTVGAGASRLVRRASHSRSQQSWRDARCSRRDARPTTDGIRCWTIRSPTNWRRR